jgi:hypothetical protein
MPWISIPMGWVGMPRTSARYRKPEGTKLGGECISSSNMPQACGAVLARSRMASMFAQRARCSREVVMANDERIQTREELERRLLAFGIEPAGVSDYKIIYARVQAIFNAYAGEMTDEIKQWLLYWDKCRDLLKMVGTEKLVVKPQPGERAVTYESVVSDLTEWLVRSVKGRTRPNRTLAMSAALAAAGTLTDRDWALMAVQQILERQKPRGS